MLLRLLQRLTQREFTVSSKQVSSVWSRQRSDNPGAPVYESKAAGTQFRWRLLLVFTQVVFLFWCLSHVHLQGGGLRGRSQSTGGLRGRCVATAKHQLRWKWSRLEAVEVEGEARRSDAHVNVRLSARSGGLGDVCLIQSGMKARFRLLATTEMCGNHVMCLEKGSGEGFTVFRSRIRGVTSSICTCEHKRAPRAEASQM